MGKTKDPRFEWSFTDEPHASRRREIRKKYGKKISELEGHDPKLKWVVLLCVAVQMGTCYLASRTDSLMLYFALMYVVGGTLNNTLGLSLHELSHGLGFKKMSHNVYFGIFANLPLGIPISVSFRKYHLEHHRFQGEDMVDSDIPSSWELSVFNSAPMKFLWCILNPLFYAIRPLFVLPKTPSSLEIANYVIQIVFDLILWYVWGFKATAYLVFGTLLGLGFHPIAGHFIAEHYTFVKGQETYSYYGPLNFFMFNVGYHNEHHDFPRIPGSRLPELRKIAPEYYDNLPYHMSYVKVFYHYIFDRTVGPWSRVKRQTLTEEALKKLS